MARNSVTLPYAEAADSVAAAQFTCELVRQGVTFTAEVDIGPNIARTDSVRVLVITLLGGY